MKFPSACVLFFTPVFCATAQNAVTSVSTPGVTVPLPVPARAAPVMTPGDQGRLKPTWETQQGARTFALGIPAPRGQIVDRNGSPLAQTRVGQNLVLNFDGAGLTDDAAVLAYAHSQIRIAETITGRHISISDEFLLRYHTNRALLPLELAADLVPEEIERFKAQAPRHLTLSPVYLRFYPDGSLAGHVLGYTGKSGRTPTSPIQNDDLLWPDYEGREGIEQTFNAQLAGKVGQINVAFDADGQKATEKIVIPPQPGNNVVLALDENIQRICESVLAKSCKRGAIVVMDPDNGDILALASWPVFNPNLFVPSISQEEFNVLQNDPSVPLLPRAYRSAYPPGSAFKVFVGLAALETGTIDPDSEFNCPPSFSLGRLTFRNWKKSDAGSLDFAGALTQSCNTWFYQVGLKLGAKNLIDWAGRVGLGRPTGIPIASEASGRIPTDEYMLKTHGRKILQGDLVNMSIGQSDILITPLQMAAAMAAVGNGGTLYQPRLVLQVQSYDNRVVTASEARPKDFLSMHDSTIAALRKGMTGVVYSPLGTAGRAAVKGVKVAGKTGTAQWGPKSRERTAAWFAGFAPATKPKYAFAALYEGAPNDNDVHGGTAAAPMIGKVLKELFKEEASPKKKKKAKDEDEEPAPDDSGNGGVDQQAKDDE
jgi:penicillin-binding protein 2